MSRADERLLQTTAVVIEVPLACAPASRRVALISESPRRACHTQDSSIDIVREISNDNGPVHPSQSNASCSEGVYPPQFISAPQRKSACASVPRIVLGVRKCECKAHAARITMSCRASCVHLAAG